MSLRKSSKIVLAGLAVVLGLGALLFVRVYYQAQEFGRCVSCVGGLIQLNGCFVQSQREGKLPISDNSTRREGGLDATQALRTYHNLPVSFQCLTFMRRYSDALARGSYRMPDWTREQWARAEDFHMEILRPDGRRGTSLAPIIWDAEPVHGGCRNVLFLDRIVLSRVPEDVFQRLRRASEEFVRAAPAAGVLEQP